MFEATIARAGGIWSESTRPIVLLGSEYWSGLKAWARDHLLPRGYIGEADLDLLQVVDTPQDAVQVVVEGCRRFGYLPEKGEGPGGGKPAP